MRTFFLISVMAMFITGCASSVGLSSDSIGVITKEYGQCLANTKNGPVFNKERVSFYCQDDRVLLGDGYEKKSEVYFVSGLIVNDGGKKKLKDKKLVQVLKGLHSVCQLQPIQGHGDKKIRRFYFDMKLKECRPFIWNGEGGFVPFKNADACDAFCH